MLFHLLFLMLVPLAGEGQATPPPAAISRAALSRVPHAAAIRSESIQQLTISWDAFAGEPAALLEPRSAVPVNRMALRRRATVPGVLPRERNPEFSPDHLLVVVADRRGAPAAWLIVNDPRVLRVETPGPDGVWTGEFLYRANAEFELLLPAALDAADIRVYQPKVVRGDWEFELLGSLHLDPQ